MIISLRLESLMELEIDPTSPLIGFGRKRLKIISRKSNRMNPLEWVFLIWPRTVKKKLIK
jgi:hypothetical protein